MFETTIGPVKEAGATVYLRPETAQGIFLDFKTVLGFARKKPPFGIAQVGKSFRNEITPGNFVFRTLEFEQMEMEFFVPARRGPAVARALAQGAPGLVRAPRHPPRPPQAAPARRRRAQPLLERHQRRRVPLPHRLVRARGHRQPRRLRPHPARPALRREARVLRHRLGRALRPARDRAGGRRRAHGAGRAVRRLRRGGGRRRAAHACSSCTRAWRRSRSPCCRSCARTASPSSPTRSSSSLRGQMQAEYDEGGSIGKRYRRQDEIGTPFCVTIDHQSLEDRTVTVRDRDSLAQERVAVDELPAVLGARLAAPWRTPKLRLSRRRGRRRAPRPALPTRVAVVRGRRALRCRPTSTAGWASRSARPSSRRRSTTPSGSGRARAPSRRRSAPSRARCARWPGVRPWHLLGGLGGAMFIAAGRDRRARDRGGAAERRARLRPDGGQPGRPTASG